MSSVVCQNVHAAIFPVIVDCKLPLGKIDNGRALYTFNRRECNILFSSSISFCSEHKNFHVSCACKDVCVIFRC